MPDLTDLDRAQAVEAARIAGAIPERAAIFARGADLSAVPRAADGTLDAAALAAAMAAVAVNAPELTMHGVVPTPSGPRRAPNPYGLGAAQGPVQGAVPTPPGSEDARVAELLGQMQDHLGIPRSGGRA